MTDEELLELEYYNLLADASYLIDIYGIDRVLRDVIQFLENPSQEEVVQAILNGFVYVDGKVH